MGNKNTADRVNEARNFAIRAHEAENQMHGDRPYWHHLDECYEVALRFKCKNPSILAAVWLHDAIEDIPNIDKATIQKTFGRRVAELVHAVSDEPGKNRAERKSKTLPKIKGTKGATAIKLFDRIANVEQCLRSGNEKLLTMYSQEHDMFQGALRVEGENEACWQHLDSLLMRSHAPAGKGEFIPTSQYGRVFGDNSRDRKLVRQLLTGEGDELLLLSDTNLYGRVGAWIVEQHTIRGKRVINTTYRGNDENAKVEFARLLPVILRDWMKPIIWRDRSEDEDIHLDVDDLFKSGAGYEDEAFDRSLALIASGRKIITSGDGNTIEMRDRNRDGIRSGLLRWMRQNPDLTHMLGDGAAAKIKNT